MKFRTRASDEKGAVLVIVAIVMTALLTLSAGGILVFTLYGANREMQKAADQGALAAAAALPLLNPSQSLDALGLDSTYQLFSGVGLDTALSSLHNIPDPRAVACAYASGNLQGTDARLINLYGENYAAGGYCAGHPSGDGRVDVALGTLTFPLTSCVTSLTGAITNLQTQLTSGLNSLLARPLALGFTVLDLVNGLVPPLLRPTVNAALGLLGLNVSQVENLIQQVPNVIDNLDEFLEQVSQLENLAPALATPRVTVTVTERVNAPLAGLIPGIGTVQMTTTSTAERRLKNVVVLPNTPLLGVDLNQALNESKEEVMNTVGTLNQALNNVFSNSAFQALGLNLGQCENLLGPGSTLHAAIDDIYNPPNSSPYTGRDLIEGAQAAVERAAGQFGTTVDAVAGEAFLTIAEGGISPTTLSNLLGAGANQLGLSSLLLSLPIPALDVAIVAAHHLENGNIQNDQLLPDTLSARGLFTSKLVK